jgi:hypothetical protein
VSPVPCCGIGTMTWSASGGTAETLGIWLVASFGFVAFLLSRKEKPSSCFWLSASFHSFLQTQKMEAPWLQTSQQYKLEKGKLYVTYFPILKKMAVTQSKLHEGNKRLSNNGIRVRCHARPTHKTKMLELPFIQHS